MRPGCADHAAGTIPIEPVITTARHLARLGHRYQRANGSQLAALARRELGVGIDLSFPPFIEWLRSEGYAFGGFDDGPLRFDERCAYLRYDVHRRDLLAAYVLADLHESFRIKGSFQIAWMSSRSEEHLKPYFLKLLEFDRRFVQFGLHAAPTASWYAHEKLGSDDSKKIAEVMASEGFTAWLLELHAAYLQDGNNAPALREIRQGADDAFAQIASSFRTEFGDWKSVSGHGNFLTNGFRQVCAQHPEVRALQPYFNPVSYFAKWGVSRFGFDYEVTELGSDGLPFPRVLYESNPEETRRKWYRGRVAHGAGFVALLHPATWTCRENATFFLPEEEAPLVSGDAECGANPDIVISVSASGSVRSRRLTNSLREWGNAVKKLMPVVPVPADVTGVTLASRVAAPEATLDSLPAQPILTRPADLAKFGPTSGRVSKPELVGGARGIIGGGIDLSFPRFVEWLRSEGYRFGGFEDGPPRFDERFAYLRYDVHQADLLAAYVLADLHERLGIVGSFQITWRFSRDQQEAEPYFVKLLEFDRRFVQFGLHAAPTATWYLYEKLGIDTADEGIVDGEDFVDWVLELYAAYCRDGDDAPGLREIRQGTDDTLSRLAASFRATFGDWKSISGHGNFLTNGFIKVRQRHPEVEVLQPYFYPEAYLVKWGLERFGFDHEVTWFGSDAWALLPVLYEGSPEEMRREWCRARVAQGRGFVALLHPASWTCRTNATFFLPEDECLTPRGTELAAMSFPAADRLPAQ